MHTYGSYQDRRDGVAGYDGGAKNSIRETDDDDDDDDGVRGG